MNRNEALNAAQIMLGPAATAERTDAWDPHYRYWITSGKCDDIFGTGPTWASALLDAKRAAHIASSKVNRS